MECATGASSRARLRARASASLALGASLALAAGCASPRAGLHPSPAGPEADSGGVRLHTVHIRGAGELDPSSLRRFTNLDPGRSYTPAELEAARARLADSLAALSAWPEAELVGWSVQRGPDGRYTEVTAEVRPGRPLVVESVDLAGPLGEEAGALARLPATRPGDRWDPLRWEEDLRRFTEALARRGHPFATAATSRAELRYTPDRIGLALEATVVPGVAVTVQRVELAGLNRTNPATARRALGLPGRHRYDPLLAERARRRLLRTGWFAAVSEPELFRDYEGRYGLLYGVRERASSRASGALGYAPEEGDGGGLAGQLEVELINPLGGGREFDLSWRRDSGQLQAFRLGYREPFLLATPLALELDLSQEVADSYYVAFEAGADLELALGFGLRASLGGFRRDIGADSLAAGLDTVAWDGTGLRGGLELDTRDHPGNPTEGGRYRLRAARVWTGNAPFDALSRSSLSLEHHVEIRRGWVGYAAFRGAAAEAAGASTLPRSEWVRLGGAASVRGYAERSLAAPRAAWGTLELRRLTGRESRFFALGDLAALEDDGELRWRGGYGFGLQVATPAGLLNLAIALPGGEGLTAAVLHARLTARF